MGWKPQSTEYKQLHLRTLQSFREQHVSKKISLRTDSKIGQEIRAIFASTTRNSQHWKGSIFTGHT